MKPAVLIGTIFNREIEILAPAFAALAANDQSNFDIMIVDDGSTNDNIDRALESTTLTPRIIRVDTARDRPNTAFLRTGHNNPAYPFNVAIKQAIADGYEYIFFYSSDVVIPPHAFAHASTFFPELDKICWHAKTMQGDIIFNSTKKINPLGWFWGTHKSILEKARVSPDQWYDERYMAGFGYEDDDFTLRVALAADQIVVDDRVATEHPDHERNYTNFQEGAQGCYVNATYGASKWNGHPSPWVEVRKHLTFDENHGTFIRTKIHWPYPITRTP